MEKWMKTLWRVMSYVLTAAVAATTVLWCTRGDGKLRQIQALLESRFIGEVDTAQMEDAAANAMVASLGDRWSYYLSAAEYESYEENKNNAYVGIGVTIQVREDEKGFDVLKVEPGGPAQQGGILPGDIITEVEGQAAFPLGAEGTKNLIRGQEGTEVSVSVLREGETHTFRLTRGKIAMTVAEGELLEDHIGLVKIVNFNENCADETIKAIEELKEQGAQSLIFDVRNNPGGFLLELTEILDHLLPEGVIFQSVDYAGKEQTYRSDAQCLEMPMAVLVNGESYSAAEFFAAALQEYDWAFTVGEQTCGKGYFQSVYRLSDGSAVGLSIGKYFTPKGISLAETGGLVPEILVEADDQTAAMIYAGMVEPEDDPQIQAAVAALQKD